MSTSIVFLQANRARKFGVAEIGADAGMVSIWAGSRSGCTVTRAAVSPACARELAAALLAHADAAETMPKGGAA